MYSNFVTRNSRLETFQSWPIQLAQTPSELASAGFFYTGCGDKVRCFSGGCELEMWEPGDKPRLEHSKWYPDCSFVRMMGEIHTETENTGSNENYKNTENRVRKEKSRQRVKRCEKIIEEDMDNKLDDYIRMDENNSERRSREGNENDDRDWRPRQEQSGGTNKDKAKEYQRVAKEII